VDAGTVDIPGRDNPGSQKWRNIQRDGRVALIVDDVLPPWQPRYLEIRGTAEALPDAVPAVDSPACAPA
jgi:pyridoxamine 5'-phosphate oxidase family protein